MSTGTPRQKGDPPLPGAGRPKGSRQVKGKTLQELAERHTRIAIKTLAEVMKDAGAPAAAKTQAAIAVLDRAHGKPGQTEKKKEEDETIHIHFDSDDEAL